MREGDQMTNNLKICEKGRYPGQKEAEGMIRFLESTNRARVNELSCYKCHICQNWHLTSRNKEGVKS